MFDIKKRKTSIRVAIGLLISLVLLVAFTSRSKDRRPKMDCEPTIDVDAQHVVYANVNNSVTINIPGFKPSNVLVNLEPSGLGSIENLRGNKYVISVVKPNKNAVVTVVVSAKSSKQKLFAKEFRVLNLPMPYVSIGGKSGGILNKAELLEVSSVKAGLNDFILENVNFEVTGYDYIYTPRRGNLLRNHNIGDQIPDDLKMAFENAARGDMLIISGVKTKHGQIDRLVLSALIFEIQ